VRAMGARKGCAPCSLTGRAFVVSRLRVGTAGRSERAQAPGVPMIQRWRTEQAAWARGGAPEPVRRPGSSGPRPCRQIAVKKKGRQPLSGDSAAPNLGLLLCRREEPHTSDTCGRLASMPKWGAGEAGSADQQGRCFISCDATARWPMLFSRDLRLRAAQRSNNAAAWTSPARGAPAGRAVCALRSGSRRP